MTDPKFAKLTNKFYTSPKPVWASEKEYLPLKSTSIVLVTTLMLQNGYDFLSALKELYLSENVYDTISDWKGEGCLCSEEDYYGQFTQRLKALSL